MKTTTKFFKKAAKWYFYNAAKTYDWTPSQDFAKTRVK